MTVAGQLQIREALPDEAAALTAIAHAAKRYWGYPEEWMLLWNEALTVTPEYISEREVFVAEHGDELVGFYALVPDLPAWQLDHFWIRPEFMGRGFGRLMFHHAVERLGTLAPGAALEIESDPNAESFYLRMGARAVGSIAKDWQGVQRELPFSRFTIKER